MALRPPQPANAGGAVRTNSLKRTISKCGIDATMTGSESSNHIAPKKLAPLHESPRKRDPHLYLQQQAMNDAYVDDGEPVLLPRYHPSHSDGEPMDSDDSSNGRDYSPVAPFGWDESPHAAKNRYYESLLDSSPSLVSPSPQHILYPYTPLAGERSTASTLSSGSSSYSPYGLSSGHNSPSIDAAIAGHVPHQVLQDRDSLSAANLHAIMTSYLDEIFTYYDLAKSFTFANVADMVQSVPFAFRYIQALVKNRLGISWHLVGGFVENILDFISDEDLREANVKEFADFLRSIQSRLYENMPAGNIFLNLHEFFQNVLTKFKKYLIQSWLAAQRIQFPCEFGKKSDTLFLCMECHREHL